MAMIVIVVIVTVLET